MRWLESLAANALVAEVPPLSGDARSVLEQLVAEVGERTPGREYTGLPYFEDIQPQVTGHSDDRLYDGRVIRVRGEVANEGSIDLQVFHR